MLTGSIDSIETFGLVDGPGIRTVVFLNGCKLRCKYCHNPEMWMIGNMNTDPAELVKKILRYKPYYKNGNGGVTFSGGEPLLQSKFLIEVCKQLKKENISVALDTAGVGNGNYEELLEYVDLILFDVKHVDSDSYLKLTGTDIAESFNFLDAANKLGKHFWIRQVIVPGIMDNDEYLNSLAIFLKRINYIDRIEFLPYHKLGSEKYDRLGISNPYKDVMEMDKDACLELYKRFMEIYNLI